MCLHIFFSTEICWKALHKYCHSNYSACKLFMKAKTKNKIQKFFIYQINFSVLISALLEFADGFAVFCIFSLYSFSNNNQF